jgi:hypothetical protein
VAHGVNAACLSVDGDTALMEVPGVREPIPVPVGELTAVAGVDPGALPGMRFQCSFGRRADDTWHLFALGPGSREGTCRCGTSPGAPQQVIPAACPMHGVACENCGGIGECERWCGEEDPGPVDDGLPRVPLGGVIDRGYDAAGGAW